jgi:2-methylcitrate dehydratase PrpD
MNALEDPLPATRQARPDAALLHAADALAALQAGLATREGRAIAAFHALPGTDDQARAIRAAGAAAVIRFTECDAIHLPSCVTPAAVALPAALAFARDAARLSTAIEAGMAAGVALGGAVGGARALAHGVWPTLLAAPVIAAVAAATALGLDPGRMAHARALALAGVSGRLGRPGGMPSGRWLAIGEATLKGLRAALAARHGFSGDLALGGPDWLAGMAPEGLADPAALTRPPVPPKAIGLKPYVTARQGLNAIVAFRALLDQGQDPAGIDRVEVALPPEAVAVAARPLDPGNRLSTIAHLGLQLGIAAFTPDRLHDVGREAPFDPRALALAGRVSVTGDPALARDAGQGWPARVTLHAGGAVLTATCRTAPGDAGDPAMAALVAARIDRVCAPDIAGMLHRLIDGADAAVADCAAAMEAGILSAAAPQGH